MNKDRSQGPVVVLFRNDFRMADNGALSAACDSGRDVVPLFVLDEANSARPAGAARRWWIHHSLAVLRRKLSELGARLILRHGATDKVLADVLEQTGAGAVFWNRRYDPSELALDEWLRTDLETNGIAVRSFDGALLHEPWRLVTQSGGSYKVYTPFWRAISGELDSRDPIDPPAKISGWRGELASDDLDDLALLPVVNWAEGFAERWSPGEDGARERLQEFVRHDLASYEKERDMPDAQATSRLSPHLAHGEITPRLILAALKARRGGSAEKFRKELVWREFSYHLLFHNPDLHRRNFRNEFDALPWRDDEKGLLAWQRGRTGYPIVDAGMRELWKTGWMHNRVRMIAASFLVKHLLVDWRLGERWFWDTLVDADCANNPASWQWVAGSGADAAPYFRIFNPILQGEKFDPDGDYVRHYVPELARLPNQYIHKPWEAPPSVLEESGVRLGRSYPLPVVNHLNARERALLVYETLKSERD
jgi:deoxyribodipyrimidine photo-lyase